MGGRKGRDGVFPATACVKISGIYGESLSLLSPYIVRLNFTSLPDDTGETITVRGCALDSGTLTTDTELIRMSHCGRFYYDDRWVEINPFSSSLINSPPLSHFCLLCRYVHGCLQSCNNADACNGAQRIYYPQILSLVAAATSSCALLVARSWWNFFYVWR